MFFLSSFRETFLPASCGGKDQRSEKIHPWFGVTQGRSLPAYLGTFVGGRGGEEAEEGRDGWGRVDHTHMNHVKRISSL